MKFTLQNLGSSFATTRWIILLAATLFLAACQPIQPQASAPAAPNPAATEAPAAEIPQITVTAKDFAFEMPAEVPAGLVSITLTNAGAVNHHAYFTRLLEGVTKDQVMAALAAEGEGSEQGPELQDLAFFMPDTDPGKSNQATVELAPGNWMVVSFSMDPAGGGEPMPDWAKGSIQEFTVVETENGAVAPEADAVITIGADDFELPAEFAAGEQTIQVVNASDADDAYVFILKLGGDTTMESILAAFEAMFAGQEPASNPEVSAVGGLMGYNLSDSFYTTVNLEPGNYAFVSNINGSDFPYAGLFKNVTVK